MSTPEQLPYRKLNYPVNNLAQDFNAAEKDQVRQNIGIPSSVNKAGKVLKVDDNTGNLVWDDGSDITATFTTASTRTNISTGEKLSVIFGKIAKWFGDFKSLAFKDNVSDSDISGTISDVHIASASTWNAKANDSAVVHLAGTETITGDKTFASNYGPKLLTAQSHMMRTAILYCTQISYYSTWTQEQKDGNHYRQWTIDLTSLLSSNTHLIFRVKIKSSWSTEMGTGELVKEICAQTYQGLVAPSIKSDYLVANGNCRGQFRISDIMYEDSKYVIRIINNFPESNNFPIYCQVDYSSVSNVGEPTVSEAIVEGWPTWAGDINTPVRVTASGFKVLTEDNVADNLASTSITNVLSANQGRALNNLISAKADDSSVVHLAGTETITGDKTFNSDTSPRLYGVHGQMIQTKILYCDMLKAYSQWEQAQKDGNHYRQWTIDLTTAIGTQTDGVVSIMIKGSYSQTNASGALAKTIAFMSYDGHLVNSYGDYIVAQAGCAKDFRISNVLWENDHYYIKVINKEPTSNNYPMFASMTLSQKSVFTAPTLVDVTCVCEIVEGWPSWAGDKTIPVRVTASGHNVITEDNLATVATTGDYNDLTNKPTIPAAQEQSDWNESNTTSPSFIRNKPTSIENCNYAKKIGTDASHPSIGSQNRPVYVNSLGSIVQGNVYFDTASFSSLSQTYTVTSTDVANNYLELKVSLAYKDLLYSYRNPLVTVSFKRKIWDQNNRQLYFSGIDFFISNEENGSTTLTKIATLSDLTKDEYGQNILNADEYVFTITKNIFIVSKLTHFIARYHFSQSLPEGWSPIAAGLKFDGHELYVDVKLIGII